MSTPKLAQQLIQKEKKEKTGMLDLGKCGLHTFPEEVFQLTWLRRLSFCNERWNDDKMCWVQSENSGLPNQLKAKVLPEGFGKLTKLTALYIGGGNRRSWEIRDCGPLTTLTQLEHLYLSNNQIFDIPFVSNLTRLKTLDLGYNKIYDISPLEQLMHIEYLDLSVNYIGNLNPLLNLLKLKYLKLRYNKLTNIQVIERFKSLTSLDLSRNQIRDIWAVSELENLQKLRLSHNHIKRVSPLAGLSNLVHLQVSANKIKSISAITNLTKLEFLDASKNSIQTILSISNLRSLKFLDLSWNSINNMNPLRKLLEQGLTINRTKGNIVIEDNPVTTPPVSVIREGSTAILNWYNQLSEQGAEQLYEARIVIVGESGSGKTTLFRKLKDKNVLVPDKKQKSTHGININFLQEFKHAKKAEALIKANIWDFGGQDIQNYLHQYFFSNDNLFILVCDHRKENTRFDYWFDVITRLCSQSLVIVVRNLIDRESATQDILVNEYEKRYSGLKIKCVDVDFKDNDARWDLLIQTIEESLSALNRVNIVVPRTWKYIREKIQNIKQDSRKYISMGEYQEICEVEGLHSEQDQELCLDYLHWLGYALHYGDSGLSNSIFIDPQWITTGLYEVLKEDNYQNTSKGHFVKDELFEIWRKKRYNLEERNLMLDLLLKDRFEVCYQVEGTENYLVPVLIDNQKKLPETKRVKPYTLRFKFPFMPYGFFSRLIVRLYNYIWDGYVWLTGVWLKDVQGAQALIEHYKDADLGDNIFEVSIYGPENKRISLLSTIRNEIYHIKDVLFKNLTILEQIPCPCSECSELDKPYFHNRVELEKMMEKNHFSSQCKVSGDSILSGKLLNSIIDMEEFEKQILERMDDNSNTKIILQNIGNTNVTQEQNISQEQNQQTDVNVEVTITNELLCEMDMLKEDIEDERVLLAKEIDDEEIDVAIKDIEKAENAVKDIEESKKQDMHPAMKSKNRLKRFVDDLSDEKSTISKVLRGLRKGAEYGVNLAEAYNKIAGSIGL